MKKFVLTQAKPGRGTKEQRKKLYHQGHIEGNKYVFESRDDSDEEEVIIHSMKEFKKEQYLEKEIQPGDTLQTLSLQFNCPISELKRINNIHRDNEIFARRIIKVPMKLFTNKLVDVHSSSSNKSAKTIELENSTVITEKPESSSVPIQVSPSIVNKVCDDRERTEDADVENFDDVSSTNPLLLQEDSKIENKNSAYNCNGADWGISWLQLLIFSLLLGFAGPILYVIYLTEDSKKKQ
ncbi:hypothetical protein L9F63_014958 [Diploptera punctata]|uniref:LysM domain-containing protein n=1 Tax=Diploptera punctata TaxID=6984 RepID=A0AAD8A7B6_DIPPU|nr:hypothetical protein L9F63_014958 [Diploptera punctata]